MGHYLIIPDEKGEKVSCSEALDTRNQTAVVHHLCVVALEALIPVAVQVFLICLRLEWTLLHDPLNVNLIPADYGLFSLWRISITVCWKTDK